jgi:hypothetical protein
VGDFLPRFDAPVQPVSTRFLINQIYAKNLVPVMAQEFQTGYQ